MILIPLVGNGDVAFAVGVSVAAGDVAEAIPEALVIKVVSAV